MFVVAACVPFFVNAGTYAANAVLASLVAGTYRAGHHGWLLLVKWVSVSMSSAL